MTYLAAGRRGLNGNLTIFKRQPALDLSLSRLWATNMRLHWEHVRDHAEEVHGPVILLHFRRLSREIRGKFYMFE